MIRLIDNPVSPDATIYFRRANFLVFLYYCTGSFLNSFWFTAKFTFFGLVLTNLLGFALAYVLTRKLFTRNLLRTVFFVPHVIGGLLLGFIWQFIFVKGFSSIGQATGWSFFNLP